MVAAPHVSVHGGEPLKKIRRPRLKTSRACQACRLRKAKCDGARPACIRCQAKGKVCTYTQGPLTSEKTMHKPRPSQAPIPTLEPVPTALPSLRSRTVTIPPTPPIDTAPATPMSEPVSVTQDPDPDPDPDPGRKGACYTAHGRFAGEVAAAIHERAGLSPMVTSNLVPFVDAPLFGELDLHSSVDVADKTLLPPRDHADELVSVYWDYVDPTEPVLCRGHFFRQYEASYASRSGSSPQIDSDIWLSILNVVFALAVQRQETIPLPRRNEEAGLYFWRAWALLKPETILWKPSSVELVQCLLLISRYLHCTNNRHMTWMIAGLSARIAQSLCTQQHEASLAGALTPPDMKLRERVWESCVNIDRCVSWSLGRAPSLVTVPSRVYPASARGNPEQTGLTLTNELLEIGNQIQVAQTQMRNGMVSRLELPRVYQQDEYHAVAVQLDDCISKWMAGMPDDWKLENLPKVSSETYRAKAYFLHMRISHTRIFLYRPILTWFYKARAHTGGSKFNTAGPSATMSDRLLRECAAMCIDCACELTSLIRDVTATPHNRPSLFPWWYRIYALHVAGTSFLAAMFTPELFTDSVARSWDELMAVLRAHEHLSTYIPQCVRTFETLSGRILETRCLNIGSGGNGFPEGTPGFFGDIFDAGFDFDNFLFGSENAATEHNNKECRGSICPPAYL